MDFFFFACVKSFGSKTIFVFKKLRHLSCSQVKVPILVDFEIKTIPAELNVFAFVIENKKITASQR